MSKHTKSLLISFSLFLLISSGLAVPFPQLLEIENIFAISVLGAPVFILAFGLIYVLVLKIVGSSERVVKKTEERIDHLSSFDAQKDSQGVNVHEQSGQQANISPLKNVDIESKIGRVVFLICGITLAVASGTTIGAIFQLNLVNSISDIIAAVIFSPFILFISHFSVLGLLLLPGDLAGISFIVRGERWMFAISLICVFFGSLKNINTFWAMMSV